MTRLNSLQAPHRLSHRWNDRWNEFMVSHHEWWSRRSDGCEQVYCLPDRVLESLCDSRRPFNTRAHRRLRFISKSDEAHERAFIDLCQQWHECAIGVTSRGEVLRFNLLSMDLSDWRPSSRPSTDNVVRMFDKGRQEDLAIEQSQMVHVARIIQQSEYWRELRAIRTQWRNLRENLPFHVISGRLIPLDSWANEMQRSRFASRDEADLLMELWKFANRWEIAAFLTWDIPIPRGRFAEIEGRPVSAEVWNAALYKLGESLEDYDTVLAEAVPSDLRNSVLEQREVRAYDEGTNATAKEDWPQFLKGFQQRREAGFFPTGIASLDEALGGGVHGTTMLVANKGVGKTSLLINTIHASLTDDNSTASLFYSLDGPKTRVMERLLCKVIGVGIRDLKASPGIENSSESQQLQSVVLPRLKIIGRDFRYQRVGHEGNEFERPGLTHRDIVQDVRALQRSCVAGGRDECRRKLICPHCYARSATRLVERVEQGPWKESRRAGRQLVMLRLSVSTSDLSLDRNVQETERTALGFIERKKLR